MLGGLSFIICCFVTMSNARSGVNRPTLTPKYVKMSCKIKIECIQCVGLLWQWMTRMKLNTTKLRYKGIPQNRNKIQGILGCWIKLGRVEVVTTFSATILTTLLSSATTRSIHLRLGSLRRVICFFTIASKAMSGVNRPTLIPALSKSFRNMTQRG